MLLQKQEGGRRYKDSPASCVLAREASWLQKSYSTHLEIIADFSSSVKKGTVSLGGGWDTHSRLCFRYRVDRGFSLNLNWMHYRTAALLKENGCWSHWKEWISETCRQPRGHCLKLLSCETILHLICIKLILSRCPCCLSNSWLCCNICIWSDVWMSHVVAIFTFLQITWIHFKCILSVISIFQMHLCSRRWRYWTNSKNHGLGLPGGTADGLWESKG